MAESPNSQLLIISAAKCTTKNPNTWKLPDCKIWSYGQWEVWLERETSWEIKGATFELISGRRCSESPPVKNKRMVSSSATLYSLDHQYQVVVPPPLPLCSLRTPSPTPQYPYDLTPSQKKKTKQKKKNVVNTIHHHHNLWNHGPHSYTFSVKFSL